MDANDDSFRVVLNIQNRSNLFHSRCITCEQFENVSKSYIMARARNEVYPDSAESTANIEAMFHTAIEIWLEHHTEDVVELFQRRQQLDQVLEDSVDDAYNIEKATDEMIDTLHRSTCTDETDESCSICLHKFECDDELITTKYINKDMVKNALYPG